MKKTKSISKRNSRPTVDVALIVMHEDRILLGEKKKSKSQGRVWDFPGGAVEHMEKIERCAKREPYEEAGLKLQILDEKPYALTEDFFDTGKHEITLLYRAVPIGNHEPKLKEKEKFHQWAYFPMDELPRKLSVTVENFLKKGYNPFE